MDTNDLTQKIFKCVNKLWMGFLAIFNSRKKKIVFAIILISLVSVYLLNKTSARVYDIELRKISSNEIQKIKELPFYEESGNLTNNEYIFTGKINSSIFSKKFIHVTPDNCLIYIKINGNEAPLPSENEKLCNYKEGIDVDVLNYLKKGQNEIEIKIKDYGGKYGLSVGNASMDVIYIILLVLSLPAFLLPFFLLLNYLLPLNLNKNKLLIILILLAIALRIFYLSYTDYNLRTHDVEGHIDYINYISLNHSLPNADQCWQCYQPPIYYIMGALVSRISQFTNLNPHFGLQIFSLLLSFLFLVFSIKTAKEVLSDNRLLIVAISLISFWPSGIIHSVRIGNDSLYYAFYAIGFYFIIKWYKKEYKKDFYLASLFSILSVLTKSSGLILASIFIVSLLYKFIKTNERKIILKKILILSIILTMGFVLAFYKPLENLRSSSSGDLFVGNIKSLNGGLSVKNELKNYLWIDLHSYFKEPFAYSWEDKGGRQNYWIFLLKTSQFGEFEFNNFKYAPMLAKYINIFLLFTIFFFLISLVFLFWNENLKNIKNVNFILLFSIIISLTASIIMRVRLPFSPTGDFRYIFPSLVPLVLIYASGLKYIRFKNAKMNTLKYIAYSPAILIPLFSIVLFILISGLI